MKYFPRQSAGRKGTCEERANDQYDPSRLVNVGEHFPAKGEGKDHSCVVWGEMRKQCLSANPNEDPKNCLIKVPKATLCCTGCNSLLRDG